VYTYATFVILVACPSLTDPNYGVVTCLLGDDEVPSYDDTCSFKCGTVYQLIGNSISTCQSNGSWSGSYPTCIKGTYVFISRNCISVCVGVSVYNHKYMTFCSSNILHI